jgi:hypothetical protein
MDRSKKRLLRMDTDSLANHQAVEDKTTHATLQPFFSHRRHPIDAEDVRPMVF